MKDKVKNAVIIVLILLIAIIGYWTHNYIENVNKVLNTGIYSSMSITQNQLVKLRAELNQYEFEQMSLEDFSNVIQDYSFDFFFYNDSMDDHRLINQAYDYLDFHDLNYYILDLSYTDMTVDEMEYHKSNIAKICMYFNSLNFKKRMDYAKPSPILKQTLEEIHALVKQGSERLKE